MKHDNIHHISNEIAQYKTIRDAYKKQFWLQSPSMTHKKRARIEAIFTKIDRCRNRLHLWLRQLSIKRPTRKMLLLSKLQRNRTEIQTSFKQLDAALYRS